MTLAKDFDPAFRAGVKRKQALALHDEGIELLAEYHSRLAAQDTWGVLVVLQALDAAGKDGTIRHVMSGVDHNWEFSAADVQERCRRNDYRKAFSEMLSHTSTDWAPWYMIPADRKWFMRIATACVLIHTLIDIDPRYPGVSKQQRQTLLDVNYALEAQAPKRAVRDPFEQREQARNAKAVGRHNGRPAAATNSAEKPKAEWR